MTEDVEDSIADLSPAGKLVYKILEYNDGLTQKELVERSRLSARTVRNVLDDLDDVGVLSEEVYLPDARQSRYELTDSAASDPGRAPATEDRASLHSDD